jgi:hypothetical protein
MKKVCFPLGSLKRISKFEWETSWTFRKTKTEKIILKWFFPIEHINYQIEFEYVKSQLFEQKGGTLTINLFFINDGRLFKILILEAYSSLFCKKKYCLWYKNKHWKYVLIEDISFEHHLKNKEKKKIII